MQLTFTSSSFYALPVPFLFFLLQSHLVTAAVVSFESPLDTRTVQNARREFRYACKEGYINNACVLHKKHIPVLHILLFIIAQYYSCICRSQHVVNVSS